MCYLAKSDINIPDYVGVVEVPHFAQQRHLSDHEGRDSHLRRVPAKVEFLHRQKALFLPHLPGFIHLPEGALSYLCQELVTQLFGEHVHLPPTKHKLTKNEH